MKAISSNDAGGTPPPMTMHAVVKLLVERLKITTQLLVDYAGCMSDPTSSLEPGQIKDANRQIVEILLGIPWTDGETVE